MARPPRPALDEALDTLGITEKDRRSVLDRLDRRAVPFRGRDARGYPRLSYRAQIRFLIEVANEGPHPKNFVAQSRNISRTGIGFLHGSALEPDTTCELSLRTVAGRWQKIRGTVAHCCLVAENVPQVGIRFNEPIDLERLSITDGS